jgi:signal transduction histidine kinase
MNSFTKQIEILDDVNKIIDKEKEILKRSSEYCACSKIGSLKLGYYNYFDIFAQINEKHLDGSHKGVRIVTFIDENSLQIVNKFVECGVNVKHVKNMPPIDFALSDRELIATLEKMRDDKTIKNLLVTNDPAYLDHFHSFFNELWNNGVDAKIRIAAIQQGISSEGIEIIQDPFEIQKIGIELVNSATKEILIIFSTENAFHRQEQIGMMQYIEKAISRGVRIRILTPFDELITKTVEALDKTLMIRATTSLGSKQFEIRSIERQLRTRVTILVVDGRFSLVVELRDDSQKSSHEAMGVATYSNSKPTVISYVSIFESMWLLTELNQKLLFQDRAQKEFVDIAAHELRTPIQPIIGLAELLSLKLENPEHRQLIDGIIRNGKRLQRITEDILDVTRIESQSLRLNKQIFNLDEVIRETVEDYSDHFNENRKIIFNGIDVHVYADKEKILQVVNNLLNNALKFTRQGKIEVRVVVRGSMAITSIIDDGTGIDAAILPRLFTKFCSNSANGTGLGLYISKNIIQAHGGDMWGENNSNKPGATFQFSLPIANSR